MGKPGINRRGLAYSRVNATTRKSLEGLMKYSSGSRAAIGMLLMTIAACSDDLVEPPVPQPPTTPPVVPVTPPLTDFPPVATSVAIFERTQGQVRSRYIIADLGACSLQYVVDQHFFEYPCSYAAGD